MVKAFTLFLALLFVAFQVAFLSGIMLKFSALQDELALARAEQASLREKLEIELASRPLSATAAESRPTDTPTKATLQQQPRHSEENWLAPLQPNEIPNENPAKAKLAILVAFRDGCGKSDQGSGRTANLAEFRERIRAHLAENNPELDYVVIVAEQEQSGLFNKGVLFNSAFLLAMRKFGADYVVFHDVDQVPMSKENTYALPPAGRTPMHLCVNSDQFQAYSGMVGGALLMRASEVVRVNGFSNLMDGWGLEDDDMYARITDQLGVTPYRLALQVGKYHALPHPRVRDLDVGDNFRRKQKLFGERNHAADGLNSLQRRARFSKVVEEEEEGLTKKVVYFRFLVNVLSADGEQQVGC